jgi:hypothetical protein
MGFYWCFIGRDWGLLGKSKAFIRLMEKIFSRPILPSQLRSGQCQLISLKMGRALLENRKFLNAANDTNHIQNRPYLSKFLHHTLTNTITLI